ncbi:MAG: cupin domain-containing protein [Sedimentisphaerales bacterium]|nr:cupin domain-containing protein [Sedimentisphaerales bacterium]
MKNLIKFFPLTVIISAFTLLAGGCQEHLTHQHHDDAMNNSPSAPATSEPFVIELWKNQDYQPLLTGVPQTCGMRSGRVFLQPGQDCGSHNTNAHEEILVFLAGNGISQIGTQGESLAVGMGKIIYIPPYVQHNIVNNGTEPLVYIYCVAPVEDDCATAHKDDKKE